MNGCASLICKIMESNDAYDWKASFERRAKQAASDFEYDHSMSPRAAEIERLSVEELLQFIDPQPWEILFDAGCGSGANISLLYPRVKQIIGMDYSEGAIARCESRFRANGIEDVKLICGDVTSHPLSSESVNKIICMSVLQYLDDSNVRKLFAEFARILKDRGVVILHVKNLSSLYLSTLWTVKKLKLLARMKTKLEYLRPFRWYVKELESFGFEILDYNSFNLLTIEKMPKALIRFLEKLELKHHNKLPLRLGCMRRHGSDLKMKARLAKTV